MADSKCCAIERGIITDKEALNEFNACQIKRAEARSVLTRFSVFAVSAANSFAAFADEAQQKSEAQMNGLRFISKILQREKHAPQNDNCPFTRALH